jgi:translation initiation factor 4E
MELHPLSKKWVVWGHYQHENNWDIQSYTKIHTITYAEELFELLQLLSEKLITNYMLFMMREGVNPMWEDEQNKQGGCFSYKVDNKFVKEIWNDLCYCIAGNSITTESVYHDITGISISPKKNFCILKIWMSSCKFQDASVMNIKQLKPLQCLFKKH